MLTSLSVVGDALKSNLTILGPIVLPWSEQIKFFLNLLLRKAEAYSGSFTHLRTHSLSSLCSLQCSYGTVTLYDTKITIVFIINNVILTSIGKEKRTPAYVPDFKKAFDHFCIHAGGRAIIDGMEENLKVNETARERECVRAS